MKFRRIRLFIFNVFVFITIPIVAQEITPKVEYKAEIGIIGGGSYYLGDASSTNFDFKNTTSTLGGFFRYRIDNRIALKGELISTLISGNGFDKNQDFAGDIVGEYNFFELEQDPYKRLSKIYSPYILAGVGLMNYNSYKSTIHSLIFGNTTNASIVFGLGFKLKLGNRMNVNVQWSNRLLLADDLEGVATLNDLNGLNGLNIFNNDLLSTLTVGFSFDIWKKECNCMNFHKEK